LLRELTDTIDKVVQIVDRGKITEGSIFSFIDFEKTPFAKGLEYMEPLIEAIQNKKCLALTYQKFGFAPETYDIHPYILKEYRKRWYAITYNEQKEEIRIYGLDRILELNSSACNYKTDPSITKDYLGDCIGINTGDHKVEQVILKFIPSEGHYLKTQAMHKSQETLSDTDDGLIIQIKVIINFELIGIVLGYGAKVTVLEPKILADKIVEIAHKITNNYHIKD
jgi:predicted DNA-binding transcriptional regulator YafY